MMHTTATNLNSLLPTVPDAEPSNQVLTVFDPSAESYAGDRPSIEGTGRPHLFNRRTGALAGAAIAVVGGTSLVQLVNQPAQYEGKFQLLVEPGAKPASDPTAQTAAQATRSTPSVDYATQMQVLWSPKLLAPVVQQLGTQYADLTYDTLAQKLEIAHRDGEKTLDITYQDTDPKKVQAVLETVSHAYLQYSQECRTSLCRELKFVEQRLPQLQKQVAIAQHNLQAFQQQHDLTEPTALGQQLVQRSSVLTQQRQDLQIRLTEARTQVAILQKRAEQKRAGQSDANVVEPALNSNDRYLSLRQQLQTIANQLSVELARPHVDTMALQALKQRYQQIAAQMPQAAQQPFAPQLAQAIADFQTQKTTDYTAVIQQQMRLEWATAAAQVEVLSVSEQAIVQTEGRIQQQIQQWAVFARQSAELNLELKFATDNLNLYKAKRAELQPIVAPKTGWQLTSVPAVEQISSGFAVSDPEHRLSLGLLLSFMVVLLVLSIAEQTKPSRPTRQTLQPLQPEFSWQTEGWQTDARQAEPDQTTPLLVPIATALTARSLPHQHATLFLLTAAVRLEGTKRAKLTV